MAAAALTTAGLGWRILTSSHPMSASPARQLDPTAVAALEAKAMTTASARPGFGLPEVRHVALKGGESVEDAVRRLGVTEGDAAAAAQTLKAAGVKASSAFEAAIARPRVGRGSARLIGLTMRTGPATSLTLSQTFDGAMKLRELDEKVSDETTVAHGRITGSLFQSASTMGATSAVTNQVVKLFAHKLDFSRDIIDGDPFTLVFDRQRTESGRTVQTGQLLFAELMSSGKPTMLYRFMYRGKWEYFDQFGKDIKGFLLRTPVDGARMNSNFGMRRHPVLGYMRMHQGVDFAAGWGTPVLAAGDGTVEEVRHWGGYGNWLKIRHTKEWETGYGHLSRYAPGIHPGVHVHQGQVVAFVGSTGLSTGPHLHYETWLHGQRVNPAGVKIPAGNILTGRELASFKAEKARIDNMVVTRERADAVSASRTAKAEGLKPLLPANRPGRA
jgi:murein DD-endopeptidase MepM/ murein hydrolase activator NlpD